MNLFNTRPKVTRILFCVLLGLPLFYYVRNCLFDLSYVMIAVQIFASATVQLPKMNRTRVPACLTTRVEFLRLSVCRVAVELMTCRLT